MEHISVITQTKKKQYTSTQNVIEKAIITNNNITSGNFLEPKSSGDLSRDKNFLSDMASSRVDIRPEGKLICRNIGNKKSKKKILYTFEAQKRHIP